MNEANKDIYQQHRYFVISRIPSLDILDGTAITSSEKAFVKGKKPNAFTPVIQSTTSKVLSPLNKTSVGFQVSKQGELTMMSEEDEYCTWSPSFVKLGEGKFVVFKDSKHTRPDVVLPLQGYEVSVVEDPVVLKKMAPELQMMVLKHKVKSPVYLIAQNKDSLQDWINYLVQECKNATDASTPRDWDEIERKSTEAKLLQESLALRTSGIRLRRAIDQSYSIESNEIQMVKVLGHGGFGTVYQAVVRNKTVAVKVFHNQNLSAEAMDDFCTEVEILAKIHHPQILSYLGACLEPLMIVTELMSGGDLEKLLLDDSIPLSWITRLKMAKDAALGMAWLHGSDPMIIHRDVKTANFLVDENLRVVVADFGLSDKLKKGSTTWDGEGYKGTIYYMSPEVLKESDFNEKSDVYSFGIVLWQILARSAPYPEFKEVKSNELDKHVMDQIVFKNIRPKIPDDCPADFKSLMEDCWCPEMDKRPSFVDIVARIDRCIYEEVILNEGARNYWTEWFPGQDRVRWNTFWEHLSLILPPPPSHLDHLELKNVVKELLSPAQDVVVNPVTTGFVSADSFGTFVECFGPIHPNHHISAYAYRILRQKWFFGSVTINQVFNFLSDQPAGTFLIRFSMSRRGDYSVSYVNDYGVIVHQHVNRVVTTSPDGVTFDYVIPSTNEAFPTLDRLVSHLKYLKTPCPGHPFAYLFAGRLSRAQIHDIFSDTAPGSPLKSRRH